MEYAKKAMTIKENLEELTKSEIVLINDGLKRYEKWGELLEIDLGMSK